MSSSEADSTFTLVRAGRPSEGATHRFKVTATQRNGSPSVGTHITVRDGWDEFKGEGYGNLKLDLPRGLYVVRLERSGAAHEEVVRHIGPDELKREEPRRSSALPAFDTADAREYYASTAHDLSLKDTGNAASVFGARGPSSDGRLFIFVRAASAGMHGGRDLAEALFLYDLAGNRLTDFTPDVVVRDDIHGWVGFSAPAPAGGYLLRHAGIEPREVVLTVFSGWETQLFVPFAERPQLARANLLLAHNGAGFHPDDRLAQAIDAGLAGLQGGVDLLPWPARQLLLDGKFDNPMLGLIGAHLLLLDERPDWHLLGIVVDNLGHLLPGAADVQALRLAIASRRGEKPPALPVMVPPMLRRGLYAVLEATAVQPEIVPEGSIIERIAPYLLAETPWSMWSLPVALTGVSAEDAQEAVSKLAAEGVGTALGRISLPDLTTIGRDQLNSLVEQTLQELLTKLGPEAGAGLARGLDEISSSRVAERLDTARQHGASTLSRAARNVVMEGVDAALSTQPERASLPMVGTEMPVWVRQLLEDARAELRKPDLAAIARQAKLPLGMLQRYLARLG